MDIVDRLKEQVSADKAAGTLYAHQISLDAASEIERLREALQALIDVASRCDGWESFPSKALDAASSALSGNIK